MTGVLRNLRGSAVASFGLALVLGAAVPAGAYGIIPNFALFLAVPAITTLPLALAWARSPVRFWQTLPLILLALGLQSALAYGIYGAKSGEPLDAKAWTLIEIAWMMRLAVMALVVIATGIAVWIARRAARGSGVIRNGLS